MISVFDISLVMISLWQNYFFQYTFVQNCEYKIRLAITGGNDMKAGLGHMIVIICMSLYYYAVFIIMNL